MRAEAARVNSQARKLDAHLITRRIRRDGSLVDVELISIVLGGHVEGFFAIYHDIGGSAAGAVFRVPSREQPERDRGHG